eukprot:TRINITY_DN26464_c0_g1_i1.p1 TRINITY_DN26464_c0_g1~~TRINITY_DN26464_c0_g1_i1.p1  ORF type:complete len:646 (-),score=169.22 TRINITY_DN26464_c0_g1_i1:10-1947(-)
MQRESHEGEDEDDSEELGAALEAKRATLELLLPDEAAAMIAKMPAAHAAQLVLLMGSAARGKVVAAMPDTLKTSIAGQLPPDTASGLGLVSSSADDESKPLAADRADGDDAATARVACPANAEDTENPTTATSAQSSQKVQQTDVAGQESVDASAACSLEDADSTIDGTENQPSVQGQTKTETTIGDPKQPLSSSGEAELDTVAATGDQVEQIVADVHTEIQSEALAETATGSCSQSSDSRADLSSERCTELEGEPNHEQVNQRATPDMESAPDLLQFEGQAVSRAEIERDHSGQLQTSEPPQAEEFSAGNAAPASSSSPLPAASGAAGCTRAEQTANCSPAHDVLADDAGIELVEDVPLAEAAQDGIVETWLIGAKPAVREQRVFKAPQRGYTEPAQHAVDTPQSDDDETVDISLCSLPEALTKLEPLPNASVVRCLSQLNPEERDALLSLFPPYRGEQLRHLYEQNANSEGQSVCDTNSSSSSRDNSSRRQALPPKVAALGERALGLAGSVARTAKQGLNQAAGMAQDLAPDATHKASLQANKAAALAGTARKSASSAASSAASVAQRGVSHAAHRADVAAGYAKQSISQLVSSTSSSSAVESSGRLAREVSGEARQKLSQAAGSAKVGIVQMSKNMAGLFRR